MDNTVARQAHILITYSHGGDRQTLMIPCTPAQAETRVRGIFLDGFVRVHQLFIPVHRIVEISILGGLPE
jgi:hypothetical protein